MFAIILDVVQQNAQSLNLLYAHFRISEVEGHLAMHLICICCNVSSSNRTVLIGIVCAGAAVLLATNNQLLLEYAFVCCVLIFFSFFVISLSSLHYFSRNIACSCILGVEKLRK